MGARAAPQAPVIVELYTSQSCSSCPDADALFEKLAQDPGLITLGCHVTYWDHLQWKDSFSLEDCTSRQRDFGQKLGGGQVYTPEAIVNGRAAMVGHDEDAIRRAARKQRSDAKTLPLLLARNGADYSVTFPGLPGGQQIPYIVTLMAYGKMETVAIGSGENGGRKVTYVHPVTAVKRLDGWNGRGETKTIRSADLPPGAIGFAVTAQAEPGAPVVAVGDYKISY